MSEQKMIVLQVDLSEDESKIQQYIDYHADVWPDVIEDLKRRPIGRMRIYNSGNRLIMLTRYSTPKIIFSADARIVK